MAMSKDIRSRLGGRKAEPLELVQQPVKVLIFGHSHITRMPNFFNSNYPNLSLTLLGVPGFNLNQRKEHQSLLRGFQLVIISAGGNDISIHPLHPERPYNAVADTYKHFGELRRFFGIMASLPLPPKSFPGPISNQQPLTLTSDFEKMMEMLFELHLLQNFHI